MYICIITNTSNTMTDEEKKLRNRENLKKWRMANKEKVAEQYKRYYEKHKEEKLEQCKQYYQNSKEKIYERQKKYRKTPIGRAVYLCNHYKRNDKKYNRGECTITAQWIVDNVFTSKCCYCQNDDWIELGCDRINNDLPHTPENVVVCCEECNLKRQKKSYEEFCKEMGVEPCCGSRNIQLH